MRGQQFRGPATTGGSIDRSTAEQLHGSTNIDAE
jgi:hypothetical protein